MTEIAPKKKRKQGKLNIKRVITGIMNNEKKIDIAPKAGSLASTDPAKCNAVNHVMKSDEYKQEVKPYLDSLIAERLRLMSAVKKKGLKWVDYDKCIKALESMTKQIQLLSGEATEIQKVDISEVKDFLDRA